MASSRMLGFTGRWKIDKTEHDEMSKFLKMIGRTRLERTAHRFADEEQLVIQFERDVDSGANVTYMQKEVTISVNIPLLLTRSVRYGTLFRLDNKPQRHVKQDEAGLNPATTYSAWIVNEREFNVRWHLEKVNAVMDVNRRISEDGSISHEHIRCKKNNETVSVRRTYRRIPYTSADRVRLDNHPRAALIVYYQ